MDVGSYVNVKYASNMGNVEDIDYVSYSGIRAGAKCSDCGSRDIARELKPIDPVPLVPIFVCRSCNGRFFSMTDEYLRILVENNPHLFEQSELEKKEKDDGAFITELKQYIISVFATRKIKRLVFE